MMKKCIVDVKETEISVKEVIKIGEEAPIDQRIGAWVILKDTYEKLTEDASQIKVLLSALESGITDKPFDVMIERLKKDGKIGEGEKPVFRVETKSGEAVEVHVNASVDKRFEIDPSLSTKAALGLVPDEYKKVSVTLDKKVIQNSFEDGTLPEFMRKLCSSAPIDTVKLLRKKVK